MFNWCSNLAHFCTAREGKELKCPFQGLGDSWETAREMCKFFNKPPNIEWFTGCKVSYYAVQDDIGCILEITGYNRNKDRAMFVIESDMLLEHLPIYPMYLSIKRDMVPPGVCLYEKCKEDKPFLIGYIKRS